MFEYFIEIKKDEKTTLNDFDPVYIHENLNRVKLHFHKYIIRLIENVCIRTLYNEERRFDMVYLTHSKSPAYEIIEVDGRSPQRPTSLINKLRIFVKTYLDNFTDNGCMGAYGPDEYKSDEEPMAQHNNLIDSMECVMRLVKHLIIYGFMDEDTYEATVAEHKKLLHTFCEMLNIRNNIRESVKFLTPIL